MQFKILSILFFFFFFFFLFFTISYARPNEMLSGVTGTGAVQGVVDGALPAVGGAVQSDGGVVQGVAGMIPELPIGGAQELAK
ncbi:Protein CBG15619 [Caenorhabditis briggsae]|uniref:Protein CBG15619 n=1 Tax=Caenorhabditis briggsae TaxID=6238 RepID=A8XME3_CAEBR|nr:Protein CBG15619 [Caenorhabditis briggsae]CAP33818.1 Protein CBG15619 [Caenorhabditis briggsae]